MNITLTTSPPPPPPLPKSYLNRLLDLHPVRDRDDRGIGEARLVQAGEGQGPLSRPEVGVRLRQKRQQAFRLFVVRAQEKTKKQNKRANEWTKKYERERKKNKNEQEKKERKRTERIQRKISYKYVNTHSSIETAPLASSRGGRGGIPPRRWLMSAERNMGIQQTLRGGVSSRKYLSLSTFHVSAGKSGRTNKRKLTSSKQPRNTNKNATTRNVSSNEHDQTFLQEGVMRSGLQQCKT